MDGESVFDERTHGFHNALGIHAVVVEDFCICTMYYVLVRDADDAYGYWLFADGLAYHGSEAAKLAVLLDGDDVARVAGSLANGIGIKRLQPEQSSTRALMPSSFSCSPAFQA